MGNKLGPALVIAVGIFLVYLTLTGKFANLVAAANGTTGDGSKKTATPTAPASTVADYGSFSGLDAPNFNFAPRAPSGNLSVKLSGYTADPTYNKILDAQISTLLDSIGVGHGSMMPDTASANVGNVAAISDGWFAQNLRGGYSNDALALVTPRAGAPMVLAPGQTLA